MSEYETFVLKDLSDLKENEDMEINIRSLEPGRYKYEAKIVRAKVSSNPDKHSDRLWIRFQKGQLHPEPWSIEIIEAVNKIPQEFM